MPLPSRLALPPVREKRIKLAAGSRCELCHGEYPLAGLEIHFIRGEGEPVPDSGSDLRRHILILCTGCPRDLHRRGVSAPEQREILRCRAAAVRHAMRAILRYRPVPYLPPAEEDLAGKFESVSHDHWGWGTSGEERCSSQEKRALL
jgi:hypothetical protein